MLAVLGLGSLVGCGGSSEPGAPAAGTSGAAPTDPIALAVYEFFDAVREGRTADANQRLTPLALASITKLDMNIAPPGSPTAAFQVGAVTTRENDHALVALTWTDVDADGKPYQEPILCELKVCDGQWRICGMAQDRGPGQPPMIMDFESLEGIAGPQTAPASAAAGVAPGAPGGAASPTAGQVPAREATRDPFQQPVQR
ncbi:MAG TPA: hypothetical protein VEQ85_07745 [Lacipirellulaceae bacterium]|nr:hypothetical protein [Lacipirellulaceae bacterium]